ncbi:hypothetical protein AB0D14_43015 [Streptomyces sp. NPDC048484]
MFAVVGEIGVNIEHAPGQGLVELLMHRTASPEPSRLLAVDVWSDSSVSQ